MRADYQTFQSAASVSLRGLILQAVLTAGLAIYAALAHDHAGATAAFHVGLGMVAWFGLVIVYDQHRRERIEAMEVDALASTGEAGASVFESREDFRPAAKRLAGLYKWFIPGLSIFIGAAMILIGLWRFQSARAVLALPDPVSFVPSRMPGWALGVGLGIAAVGFVVARYAAGLAKQPVWANLRAGAAATVAASLLGLALAVGHLIDYVGPDAVARALPLVFPVVMMVLGVEVFINFVLDIYRPRRVGETPRPAFDSRLLGFAAAPDRIAQSISGAISYQVGFDVTSGWMYRLLSRSIAPLVLVGGLVVWLMSCVVVVQPHQRAMILRWGKPTRTDLAPGPHFKWMWPLETVYIPEYFVKDGKGRSRVADLTATGLRRVELGSMPPATTEPILWTNDHVGDEVWQFVRIDRAAAGGGLTDVAAVSVEIPMHYAIKDVYTFDQLAAPEKRDDYLRAVARREVTRFFQNLSLDEVLGGDRATLSSTLRGRVQAAFDGLNPDGAGVPRGAGVEIVFLGITGVHPPKSTAAAFETPVQAGQRREANLAAAQTDATQLLTAVAGDADTAHRIVDEIVKYQALTDVPGAPGSPAQMAEQEIKVRELLQNAGGSASVLLAEARARRWNTHMDARRDAVRYAGQLYLFEASPHYYRVSRYFDSLREVIKDSRLYIVSDTARDMRFDLDLKDKDMGIGIFSSEGAQPN